MVAFFNLIAFSFYHIAFYQTRYWIFYWQFVTDDNYTLTCTEIEFIFTFKKGKKNTECCQGKQIYFFHSCKLYMDLTFEDHIFLKRCELKGSWCEVMASGRKKWEWEKANGVRVSIGKEIGVPHGKEEARTSQPIAIK